ncbi:hypothetical protein AUEXF2481DRAFT_26343 [Aureobasidium subglaciale EXF-2481]|uniref:Uncharacterized protein n=1 Tax=Aureobasidium subglaciale (strain EXF-2481) TaxID=1043005 RepID=A0A074ZL47_AURSE|nr:uncharacterized protein AUEXF2481DRAFT_26343 [Aureobasidium subglaciale EXF-2481]KAI5207636.1 hypothetical protein E4T38_03183 [Aureobasidium subglaciale]KAI5226489.1 hypothetical protein E4T40_02957 [Aureobasidium subglaciale]KAI5229987.1 hypothetical protein E4T41_03180 [Aureobasidium subglaciale]KAI5264361.1 hypothetical protein E4T46_02958 [Aureobasidium subglaciale]KEQ99116.1 hypothetical protein AUEXF2481DRAFT_26343 [Aureobasidium subglaciale EXF-2481]
MSDPFSDMEKLEVSTTMPPRPAMPFGEENVEVESEVKMENVQDSSSLFEPQTSAKRPIKDEDTPEAKRTKCSNNNESFSAEVPFSYSGDPVRIYAYPEKYDYAIHEVVPKLEVNSNYHRWAEQNLPRVIRQKIIPKILPFVGEDDEMKNYHTFFSANQKTPMPEPMWCSLVGDPGTGKSTLMSHLAGIRNLASSGNSSESMTQSPMVFSYSTGQANFEIKVVIRYKGSIKSVLRTCFQDLIKWFKLSEVERSDDDNDLVREAADAAQEYLNRLFPENEDVTSLPDIEDMMQKKGLLAGGDPDPIISKLHTDVLGRIHEQGFDWESRSKTMTAESLLDMSNKIKPFTERGDLAPIVTSIQIGVHSSFLAQGIQISDLPGIRDTNTHTSQVALDGFEKCPRTIVVGDVVRCLSKPELAYYLSKAVREKGAGNVWLVLRGKEIIEEEPARCSAADKSKLRQMKDRLEKAQAKIDISSSDEQIKEVKRLEKELLDERLDVRDRSTREQFQKKYFDTRNTGDLNVVIISNIDYSKYVNGPDENNPPTLSYDQTGIDELRAQLCSAPSRARVESLRHHNLKIQQMLRRLRLTFSAAQLPRRDRVIAVFETSAFLPMKKHQKVLTASTTRHNVNTLKLLRNDAMVQEIEAKIDGKWAKYPAATISSFFKKNGKHKHSIKKITQQPEFWTEAILLIVSKHLLPLEQVLFDEVDKCSSTIIESMGDTIADLKHEIGRLEQVGGVDMEEIFEIWDKEKEAFEEEMLRLCTWLKEKIRQISTASTTDTGSTIPAFAESTQLIYQEAMTEIPPGTSQGPKKRLKHLKRKLFDVSGPFSKMGDDVSTQLKRISDKWISAVERRVKTVFDNCKDALLNEFKGKRMSPEKRAEIAPGILATVDDALQSLKADVEAYKKARETGRQATDT